MDKQQPRIILAVAPEQDDKFIWDHVRTIQAEMFAAGPVNIKFAYFGQEGALMTTRPFVATEWATDPDDMNYIMDEGRANCVCGCYVLIDDILDHALQETQQGPVQAVIIVGDRFDGDPDKALATAKQLQAAVTRLVFFQQVGRICHTSPDPVFKALADATDGACFQFNPQIERVAERLPGLLKAVSHLAIGGPAALKALDHHEGATLLLEQIEGRTENK